MPMITYAASSHTNASDGWTFKAIYTVTPKAPPIRSTVRQLSRRSLNDRNGIELTMKTDSMITSTEMMIGVNGSLPVK